MTKICTTVLAGQPNLLTAVVTNCGDVPVTGVQVTDNLYGPLCTLSSLAPGATLTCAKVVTNTCGSFTNVVTASGMDSAGIPVSASSTNVCIVTGNPCMRLTTTCTTVIGGQPNLLTAVVTNCGDIPITGLQVTDNLYGPLCTLSSLAPGSTLTCAKVVTNTCGEFPNVVTATATSPCGGPLLESSTNVCIVTGNPCMRLTKLCTTVVAGQPNVLTAVVTNCGDIPITGLQVTDNLYGPLCTLSSLAPGATLTCAKVVTNTCGEFPNVVTASGTSPCGGPLQVSSTGVCSVVCGPKICVTKEVVCELPTGCANNWSSFASGAKTADDSQCPSFCYRFRVTNCGAEDLRDVTVVDDVQNLSLCNFPTTLAVGQTVECIVAGVLHCTNTTNTVTASGVGLINGSNVTASATAAVEVLSIGLTCNATVNGQSSNAIPCEGQAHVVTNAIEVCNTGQLPLTDIVISAPDLVALGGDCTNIANLRLSLLPGECTNVVVCSDALSCQPSEGCGPSNVIFSSQVTVTGVVDGTKTNVCSWTRNPSNQVVTVTASSRCSVIVTGADVTPPQATCVPGFNPSGKKIPVAGKNPASGQNPDGYYQLLARDDCDPSPAIYIADTGSTFVAGPFASGDVIKLTQSPGKTPSSDPAPDPIVAHAHLRGDGLLFAVDASGNISEPQLCLVPRPPK